MNEKFLLRDRLSAFTRWLDQRGIAYRDGKGEYQALQVYTQGVWHVLHVGKAYPMHYKAVGYLAEEVEKFVAERND
jgi:hypothetical protein